MIEIFFNIGLIHYLVVSFVIFLIGILGILLSRNLLRIVMSMCVISISIVINFVVFAYYCDVNFSTANMISMFVLLISMMQMVVALVILYKIYKANEYLDAEKVKEKES